MKLISMADFVIDRDNNELNENLIKCIFNYANFLKQPLELWMFVPCDEDGNVLEEPCKHNSYCVDFCQGKCQENYNEAKERCLFDGFKLDGKYLWLKDGLYMISNNYNETFKNNGNIESLLNKYPSLRPTLTPTAIKKITL